jgi:hypothetical protein
MQMTPAVMYEQHTISSLTNAIKGYFRREERLRAMLWDQTRFSTFHLLNIQLAAKDKLKTYTDLVRFPWEPETKKVKITSEILKEYIKKS